jgi:hypothetical protein
MLDLHRFKEVNDKHGHARRWFCAPPQPPKKSLRTSDYAFASAATKFCSHSPKRMPRKVSFTPRPKLFSRKCFSPFNSPSALVWITAFANFLRTPNR